MLIKGSINVDIFNPYEEDEEEDLEVLMWELEELNQGYKQGTQSWDLQVLANTNKIQGV